MKTENPSYTQQPTHICKNCNRELPCESFYVNKSTQCPDKFCKECRKAFSRQQYSSGKRTQLVSSDRISYPVITQIADRELRIQLILHALRVVQQSMERKK